MNLLGPDPEKILAHLRRVEHELTLCCSTGCDRNVAKAELQAAIKLLEPEPPRTEEITVDWETAPAWANYWALDYDGASHWFEKEPEPTPYARWWTTRHCGGNRAVDRLYRLNFNNWKDTLRERKVA